jgi:hypothetical protein
MADLIPPMLIKLQADVSELKTGLTQAQNALKGVDDSVKTASKGMESFATKIKQVGASIGIAFAGTQVLQFGKDVMAQAMEAEAQQQRLAQLMKVATGATDEQIASLNAQADALEKVGVVTGGNITQTQSQLATFNLQTDTIKRLTPAILDYVTAEKGANASADEFKQMTNGLAQALNGNFGSLTRVGFVLDEHTKKLISEGTEAEKSAAIVKVLNSTYKGFNEELRNTPEGQMQALRNDFNKLKEDLGKQLLPAFRAVMGFLTGTVIPGLRSLGKFIKENQTVIMALTGAVVAGVVAWKAYRAILVITSAVTKAYTAIQTVMRTGTLASIASTNGLAASMLKLNAAMRANPIGVIVTAVALLATGFVILYKKSETFRNGVATVAKAVLSFVAFMIRAWGEYITIVMKVVTGPMRLFLTVLSKLPGIGGAAKAGLKLINAGIEGVGDTASKVADKIEGLKKNVDSFTAAQNKTKVKDKETTGGGGGGGGGGDTVDEKARKAAEKAKKALEKYKKEVTDIYADINEAVADAQEKADEELIQRNERMLEAHKNYDERVADLQKNFAEANLEAEKNYNDAVVELQYRYNDTKEKANKRYKDTLTEAEKRYGERIIEIEKDYSEKKADLVKKNQETIEKATKAYNDKIADLQTRYDEVTANAKKNAAEKKVNIEKDYGKKIADLTKNLENKLSDLRESASKRSADLTKSAADKQLNIVQQSMDRLRNAFASKTGFDLGEALAGGSPEQALNKLKKSLEEAKKLQANAAALAGMGYSQVFIEEIVKQGPQAGNKIAEALKNASPEATAELQSLYGEVQNVSTYGLDALATTMNQGGKLATKELTNAYNAVSTDLTAALSQVQQTLNENLADANASYLDAMAEAKINRDERLAEAESALLEALASAKKDLNDGLADALKTMNEAIIEANKDLAEGLAEAEKNYLENLAKAKKDLDDAIADAAKTLAETMAEAQKDLDKGMADAAKSLKEAREKAQKDLAEGLADAAKTLQDALLEAQKNYEKAIDKINKSTSDKLADLKQKLSEVAAEMAKLGTAAGSKAAVAAITNAPGYVPIIPQGTPGGGIVGLGDKLTGNTTVITQTFNNAIVDPSQVRDATVSGIKYGDAVTISGVYRPGRILE